MHVWLFCADLLSVDTNDAKHLWMHILAKFRLHHTNWTTCDFHSSATLSPSMPFSFSRFVCFFSLLFRSFSIVLLFGSLLPMLPIMFRPCLPFFHRMQWHIQKNYKLINIKYYCKSNCRTWLLFCSNKKRTISLDASAFRLMSIEYVWFHRFVCNVGDVLMRLHFTFHDLARRMPIYERYRMKIFVIFDSLPALKCSHGFVNDRSVCCNRSISRRWNSS